MSFLVSPGVSVREVDLTNVVPAVATSVGAIAGAFQKGPVSSVTTITSEEQLVQVFGKPNSSNFETFFTATNFLQYADNLKVVRAASGIVNAGANSGIKHLLKMDLVLMENGPQGLLEHMVTHLVLISVQVQERLHNH